jgi:arylsulfatase A-like enzyme
MMADTPNILLLLTDQQRLSAVGAYGDTPCQTPNIDRLAEQGVRFETVYTTCPVCSPARGTLMTGHYPHRHGINSNIHELGCSVHELQDRPELLSRRLEAAGYRLGYTGKWHLGSEKEQTFDGTNRPSLPRDMGFTGHNAPGHGDGGFEMPEYQQYLAENGWSHLLKPWTESTNQIRRAGELTEPTESTVAYFLAENTINLIDEFRTDDQPFFIWHNFWGPHEPYYAPQEFLELYREVEIPPWPNYEWPARTIPGLHHVKIHPYQENLSWPDWETTVRYYYALASLIDSQIGRILNHVEQTGLLDNTIVIFAADHGETLGSHGGLVDKGWHHFEETHRVPLIMRFPNGQYSGMLVEEFVSLADFYPTILDMAQATWDKQAVHGVSLLPLLSGEAVDWREYIVTEFGGLGNLGATQRTLRWQQLKYGYNAGSEDELYDLERDPHETRNLIRHPDYVTAVNEMRTRLADWMAETHDPAERMFRQVLNHHQGSDSMIVYTGSP